jgi:transcriptional regulator with XRE-family HTH domain
MASHLHNYLWTYRKRPGLSQVEMALLLGSQSGAKVSRYEHTARRPSLETAFAYEVVLHASLRDLFAGMYRDVEKQTKKRTWTLLRKLESADPVDSQVIRKIALLRSIQGGTGLDAQ